MSKPEIDQKIREIQISVADFTTENLETFSQQVTAIEDRRELLDLKDTLESARDIYNIARLLGYTEILNKLNFKKLAKLLTMVADRIKLLNLRDAANDVTSRDLLNTAIEDVVFIFNKTGEEELKLLSEELHSMASKIRYELEGNFNKKDPEWMSLYEAFVTLLTKHNIDPNSESFEGMKFESTELKRIFSQIRELNRKNSMLLAKFGGDQKFAIIFKNQQPTGKVSDNLALYNLLSDAKKKIDGRLANMHDLLANPGFFRQATGEDIVSSYEQGGYKINSQIVTNLITQTTDEYTNEYRGDQS